MRIRRLDLSWSRWNEFKTWRPDRGVGVGFVEYRWGPFRLVITRAAR